MAFSTSRYNVIMGASLIVAVVSAFTFDRAGSLQWLVGASGIVAAMLMTVMHFWQFRDEEELDKTIADESEARSEIGQSLGSAQATTEGPVIVGGPKELKGREEIAFARLKMVHELSYVRLQYRMPSPRINVDSIVEIIHKLSGEKGRQYEFQLTREGYLNIRPLSQEEEHRELARRAASFTEWLSGSIERAETSEEPVDTAREHLASWQPPEDIKPC